MKKLSSHVHVHRTHFWINVGKPKYNVTFKFLDQALFSIVFRLLDSFFHTVKSFWKSFLKRRCYSKVLCRSFLSWVTCIKLYSLWYLQQQQVSKVTKEATESHLGQSISEVVFELSPVNFFQFKLFSQSNNNRGSWMMWFFYVVISKYSRVLILSWEKEYLQANRLQTDCSFNFWLDAHTTLQRVASIQKRQTKLNHNS